MSEHTEAAAETTDYQALQQRIAELEQQVNQLKMYQQCFDTLPIPLQIYLPDGTMAAMNSASEQYWKARREQSVGKFNLLQVAELQAEGVPTLFQQAAEGTYVETSPIPLNASELHIEHTGIDTNWIITSYFPISNESEVPQYVGVMNRDITAVVERTQALEVAQAQLQESQNLFTGLIAYSPSSIFVKNTEGTVIVANQQIERLFEMEPGTMVGKTAYDLLPKAMADAVWQSELQVLETGEPLLVAETIQAPDGIHTLLTSKFPIYNTQDEVYAIGGIITDITEQRQAEEQLRMTQFAVDKAADSVFLIRADARFAYVNDMVCQALGYTREELLTMGVDDVDPMFPMEQWNTFWEDIKQHTSTRIETQHRRKDGTTFPVEVRLNFFTYRNQEYMYAFARDITESQQKEKELRRYAAIIEAGIDGVAIADPDKVPLMVNRAFRLMIGAALDAEPAQINMGDSRPAWAKRLVKEEAIPTALRDGIWSGETALLHLQTGEEIPVSQVLMAHKLDDGTIDFFSTIVRDLTPIKQAESERTALQQQVIDAQQHAIRELSTPLIPLSRSVVLMPLIGSIDSNRAQLVMETLLEGIASHQAETAIIDITGVSVVDTQVANALVQTAQAVQLLGAQVVLTGIGPTMAQTLVHLGADLSSITTRGSLQSAVVDALQRDR
jgi:rsbT co-antagonist protein RsbR